MSNTITITHTDGTEESLRLYKKFSRYNGDAPEADKIIDLKKTASDSARSVIVLKRLKLEEGKEYTPGWNFQELRCRETVSELAKTFAAANLDMPPVFVPMKVRLTTAKNLISRKP